LSTLSLVGNDIHTVQYAPSGPLSRAVFVGAQKLELL
jgi:hypothetical protein